MEDDIERLRRVVSQSKNLQHISEEDIVCATPLPKPEIGKVGYRLKSGDVVAIGFKDKEIMWDVDSGAGSDWT